MKSQKQSYSDRITSEAVQSIQNQGIGMDYGTEGTSGERLPIIHAPLPQKRIRFFSI